jgi:hypothetical protein
MKRFEIQKFLHAQGFVMLYNNYTENLSGCRLTITAFAIDVKTNIKHRFTFWLFAMPIPQAVYHEIWLSCFKQECLDAIAI